MVVGAEVVEVLDVPAAYLTKMGLGHPTYRFATFATLASLAVYIKNQVASEPSNAFRKDRTFKPLSILSYEPDAVQLHKHFLFYPVLGSFVLANVI